MLLGIVSMVVIVVAFIFAVVWLVRTENKLDRLQTKKLEELRSQLRQQYCDDWFPLVYDADGSNYGRSLPTPFHIKRILTIDAAKRTFELYTVMAKGENIHKSIPFSDSLVDLPEDLKDLQLGINIKGVDFIYPKLLRPGEPIVASITKQPTVVVHEFAEALAKIVAN